MARGGRPRKPTKIHVLQGTRTRTNRKREPRFPSALRPRPDWMTGHAAAEWDRVVAVLSPAEVLTEADWAALEMLCAAYGEYHAAREALEEHGLTYETVTETGAVMVRQRPEVQIRSDAWKRYRSLFGDFGLSPASRSKVQGARDGEPDNPVAEWMRRHVAGSERRGA